jgi:hypothetical protein
VADISSITDRPTALVSAPSKHRSTTEIAKRNGEPLRRVGRPDRSKLGFVERVITTALHAPEDDSRDWEAVDAWVADIAAAVTLMGRPG